MEEWRRAADDVLWGEDHAVADLGAVVEDGSVGEACCFGHCGRAGRKLDVYDIAGGEVLGIQRRFVGYGVGR